MPQESGEIDRQLIELALRWAASRRGRLHSILIRWEGEGIAHEELLAPSGYFAGTLSQPEPVSAGPQRTTEEETRRTLTPLEMQIMELLRTAEFPLKQSLIALRLQRENTPHFRTCCGRLRAEGYLVRITVGRHTGYWRADRPLPATGP